MFRRKPRRQKVIFKNSETNAVERNIAQQFLATEMGIADHRTVDCLVNAIKEVVFFFVGILVLGNVNHKRRAEKQTTAF